MIIEVGGLLGTWATLFVIGVTAMVGAALAKSQGTAVLTRLQTSMTSGEGTGTAIVEGALILAAGVTLLAPGFITDAIGLALLVPPIRKVLATHLASKVAISGRTAMSGVAAPFYRDDDEDPPPPGVIDV